MRIISGQKRGMKLRAPPGRDTRPVLDRVKQSWFDVLGERVDGAAADLYCGVGSLGLEALSRGASSCVFVEKSRECVELLREHLAKTGFDSRARIVSADARVALEGMGSRGERFDCVFLDPPFAIACDAEFYREGGVLDLAAGILSSEGLLMLRRERAGGRKKGVARADDALPPGLEMRDNRSWGRNEVVFIGRGASSGTDAK